MPIKTILTADTTSYMADIKRALIINDSPVTVPVAPEVQDALNRWSENYTTELAAVLAPFGLHPYDLAQPQYRRVVTID